MEQREVNGEGTSDGVCFLEHIIPGGMSSAET